MTEAARSADVPYLPDRAAQKTHRWTRWRDGIPKHYRDSVDRPPSRALELASELARRADNETGHCWSHYTTLHAATGLSPRTLQRAKADLERNGLITAKGSGRQRIDFWLQALEHATSQWRSSHATVADQIRHPDASEASPCRICDDTVATLTAPGIAPINSPITPPELPASCCAVPTPTTTPTTTTVASTQVVAERQAGEGECGVDESWLEVLRGRGASETFLEGLRHKTAPTVELPSPEREQLHLNLEGKP